MTELNDSEKLFLQEKVPVALIFIASSRITYISEVADAIGSNFAHTKKVVTKLESGGYISSFFQGRTRYLHLTPKGWHLAESLKAVMALINTDAESFSFPSDEDADMSAAVLAPETIASGVLAADAGRPVSDTENADEAPGAEPMSESAVAVSDETEKGASADAPKKLSKDVSTALFMERIGTFSARIREIYERQTAAGADHETIRRNLGPFDRELKMIERDMRAEQIDNAALTAAFCKAADTFAMYMDRPPQS